jgi:hypothetical protein
MMAQRHLNAMIKKIEKDIKYLLDYDFENDSSKLAEKQNSLTYLDGVKETLTKIKCAITQDKG